MFTTLTNETKNTASITNETRGLTAATLATAGQAMGLLLALTYSGGQIITPGHLPVLTNEIKH